MKAKVTRGALFSLLRNLSQQNLPEHRKGNLRHPISRAVMTAFSVFYLRQSSLLEHEENLKLKIFAGNAKRLFGPQLSCMQTVRNILDPIDCRYFATLFDKVFARLDRSKLLEKLSFNSQIGLLLSLDGTEYFSSKEISCANCSHACHKNGEVTYSHKMLTAGIAHPIDNLFIPLAPEFIVPQDGAEKQDCERNAAKRWLQNFRLIHKAVHGTILVDSLHANHKFLTLVQQYRLQFIAACKEGSSPSLYEWIETARQGGDTQIIKQQVLERKKPCTEIYEYYNSAPMRDTEDALKVNFASYRLVDTATGQVLKRFDYVTDIALGHTNIMKIITAGRKRWKVENEGHNVLKNQGYYFEHNYGHGKHHLSSIIATLILYAFLVHNVLKWVRQDKLAVLFYSVSSQKRLFEVLRSTFFFYSFSGWEHLYSQIYQAFGFDSG